MPTLDLSTAQEIYTVSRLNREARLLLERQFALVWIEGEISNFSAPSSGHWYFSLKDANAQVRCAMFRLQTQQLQFVPENGMQLLARAKVGLYENRGDFQLVVEHLEVAGEGALRQAFEALKQRLFAAGLFAETRKRGLPHFPKCIGVVTSPTGAAIRDILSVLKRRMPHVPVIIYPAMVQGDAAAPDIVNAIQSANRRQECDVLIVARGGGSLEDLWPFNDERVAYAVYQSGIPVISGVGHEIDVTIIDFVADCRAATPSAAAELVSKDSLELTKSLAQVEENFLLRMQQKLSHFQQNLVWINKHLQQQHPKRRLQEQQQQLDFLTQTLIQTQTNLLLKHHTTLRLAQDKLAHLTPTPHIHQYQLQLTMLQENFKKYMQRYLEQIRQQLAEQAGALNALSPLATLQRGFAIVLSVEGKLVQSRQQVHTGDKIKVQLQDGQVNCLVE